MKSLFNLPKINLSSYKDIAPQEAFNKMHSDGVPKWLALYTVLEQRMETDWKVIFDNFEKTGGFEFVEVKINGLKILVNEFHGEVEFNGISFYSVLATDEYNTQFLNKIKSSLKDFIRANYYQIETKFTCFTK